MEDKAYTNLANVDVGALWVDLRVVQVKDGGVDFEVRHDLVASIVSSNDIGCRAVLAKVPKAEGGSWNEVSTG
jgi:hypothetical protein